MTDPGLLDLVGKPLLHVLGGLEPRGSAALLCTCRLLLDFQDKQAGDIWQRYVCQHLGPSAAALHQLPVARGQLCEQGRYWRLVFSSSQLLQDATWWRAGSKQLLRSCTGKASAAAAAAAAVHSAPLAGQQQEAPYRQHAPSCGRGINSSKTAAAEALLARAHHTATIAGHLLVLVGGRLRDVGSMDGSQDLCVVDMRSLRVLAPEVVGRPLGPRQQHSTLLIPWSQQRGAAAEPQGLLEYTALQVLRQLLPVESAAPPESSSGPGMCEVPQGAATSWQQPAAPPAEAASSAPGTPQAAAGAGSDTGLSHLTGAAAYPDVLVTPVAAASAQLQHRLAAYRPWVHAAAAVPDGRQLAAGCDSTAAGAVSCCSGSTGPAAPPPRGHLLVVLGGVDGQGVEVPLHTLDCLWLSEEGEDAVWFQVRVPPLSEDPDDPLPAPSPRAAAAVHLLPCGQQVLLYGGAGPEVADDWTQSLGRLAVHILDLSTLQWRKQSTRAAGDGIWCVPGVRSAMVSTLLERQQQALRISGGGGGTTAAAAVASFTSGRGEKGAVEGDLLVVLGGRDVSGHIHGTEPFALDLSTWRWHMLLEAGASPPPTWGAASYRIGDRWLLCYGGMDDHGQLLSRLDCFDLTALRWVGQPAVKGRLSSSLPRATTGTTFTAGLLLGGLVQGMFGRSPAPLAGILLLSCGREEEGAAGSGHLARTAPQLAIDTGAPASNRLLQLLDGSSSDEGAASSSCGRQSPGQQQLHPWGGAVPGLPAAAQPLQQQALPASVVWPYVAPAAAGYGSQGIVGTSSSSSVQPGLGQTSAYPPMLVCLSEPEGAAGAAPEAATAAAVPMVREGNSFGTYGLVQSAGGAYGPGAWPPATAPMPHGQEACASGSAGCWLGHDRAAGSSSLGYGAGAAGSSYAAGAAGSSLGYAAGAAGSSLGYAPAAAGGGPYGGGWGPGHGLSGSSSYVGLQPWQAGGSSNRAPYVDHLGSSGFRYSAQCLGPGGVLGGLGPLQYQQQQHQHQQMLQLQAGTGMVWEQQQQQQQQQHHQHQQQQQGAGSSHQLPPHVPSAAGSGWGAGSAPLQPSARRLSMPPGRAQQQAHGSVSGLGKAAAAAAAPGGGGYSYLPPYLHQHSAGSSMDLSGERACNSMGALGRPPVRSGGGGVGGAGSSRFARLGGPEVASATADAAALRGVRALFGPWDGAAADACAVDEQQQQQQKARRNSAPSPRGGRLRASSGGGLGLFCPGDQRGSSGCNSDAASCMTVAGVYAAAPPLEWEEEDGETEDQPLGADVPNPGKSGSTSESIAQGSSQSGSSAAGEGSEPDDSGAEDEMGGISFKHGIRGRLLIKRAQQRAAEAAASADPNSGDFASAVDVRAHLVDLVEQLQQQQREGSQARLRKHSNASSLAQQDSPARRASASSSSNCSSSGVGARRLSLGPGSAATTLTRRSVGSTAAAAAAGGPAAAGQGGVSGSDSVPSTQGVPSPAQPLGVGAQQHVATTMQLHWRLLLVVQALLVGTMLLVMWQHWL